MDENKLLQLADLKISYIDIAMQWKRGKSLKDFLDSRAEEICHELESDCQKIPHELEEQVPKGKRRFYDKNYEVLEKAWEEAIRPKGSPERAIEYAQEWICEINSMYTETRKKIELLFRKSKELADEGSTLSIKICEYESRIKDDRRQAKGTLNKDLLESYVENKYEHEHVQKRIMHLNSLLDINYDHYAKLQSVIDDQIKRIREQRK